MRCWCPDGMVLASPLGHVDPMKGRLDPTLGLRAVPLLAVCQPLTMLDSVNSLVSPSPNHPGLCLISKSKDWRN